VINTEKLLTHEPHEPETPHIVKPRGGIRVCLQNRVNNGFQEIGIQRLGRTPTGIRHMHCHKWVIFFLKRSRPGQLRFVALIG
jgi:hypothetical protein